MIYRGNRSNSLEIKPSFSPYIPSNTSYQRCIQEAINEVSSAISLLIKALEQIYERFSIGFLVKKQYIHKVIMSMIAPVQIKIQYDIDKTHYFSEMAPVNQGTSQEPSGMIKKNHVKNEDKGIRKNQSQVLDKSYIIKQFRQDLQNIQKLKNQTKNKLIQKLQQKIKRKQEPNLIKSEIIEDHSMINESNVLSQAQKYSLISKWIKEETKTGKFLRKQKLLDKVKEINHNDDMKNANAWLQDYFLAQKQMVDHLTYSGNSHVLNFRLKTSMQDEDSNSEEETLKMMVKDGQVPGKSSEGSNKLGEARVKFRYL